MGWKKVGVIGTRAGICDSRAGPGRAARSGRFFKANRRRRKRGRRRFHACKGRRIKAGTALAGIWGVDQEALSVSSLARSRAPRLVVPALPMSWFRLARASCWSAASLALTES